MKFNKSLLKTMMATLILSGVATSCSDDDPVYYQINVDSKAPEGYTISDIVLNFTELNTKATSVVTDLNSMQLTAGTYNVEGTAKATAEGVEKHLRVVAENIVITQDSKNLNLDWFFYNPDNSLIFSEIFIAGSLNAKGTGMLYDSYFRIYNNTDDVIYADGLALCESENTNTGLREIKTEEAKPTANFTVQTIYVIPGNGTQYPIQPGQSIKIADQAVDFTEQVKPAMNNTDADFEWYDDVTIGTLRDTDNNEVPNLDKWFSYSRTIWIPTQQCNRSYALVRFPQGMTSETFLTDYDGTYTYTNTKTGTEMTARNCYRIPNDWIIDGVNLCGSYEYQMAMLAPSVDISYASIADSNDKTKRAGKMFARKVAGKSPAGNTIYQDTNDSANDFEIVSVYK
ncbi:MAG: DUF4876 domain-containing protein [Clostridiales bacterium]|nr:DUF4876 domain-containing protein [Clostridiales bacterium]